MKIVKMMLVAVMLLIALVGCTAGRNDSEPTNRAGTETGGVVEIEFGFPGAASTYEPLVDAYNKSQNNYRVTLLRMGSNSDELTEQLQAKAVADKLPDLTTSSFSYGQFYADNLPITPVQTFVDREKYDLSDFYPEMLELGRGRDGKLDAMPFAVSTSIVFLNADLFEAANLDSDQFPKTWDELRRTAQQLTKDDQHGIYFDYISGTGNIFFQNMLETAGGKMLQDDKHAGFNSPAGRQAVQFWHDLQAVDRSMPNLTRSQADQSFLSGKLAMVVMSSARLGYFTEHAKFNLKTALYPMSDGSARKVVASGNGLMILAKDPVKQQAAWDFIKFATSPEGSALNAQATGYMAVRRSAVEKPELMGDYLRDQPNARMTYDQVGNVVPWNVFPGPNGPRVDAILKDNITAAMQGQKTVEQALADAEEQANRLLSGSN